MCIRDRFPTDQGDNLQVLQTDGSGTLSWVTISDSEAVTTNFFSTVSINSLLKANNVSVNGTVTTNKLIVANNTFPINQGSASQVLQTDGSGTLSWVTVNDAEAVTTNFFSAVTINSLLKASSVSVNGTVTANKLIVANNTFPTDQGNNLQVLQTDGSGTLSLVTVNLSLIHI